MNNLCDEQVIQDNNYTNTYSLWGNSKYYDIKNLSPQNYCVNSTTSETNQASRCTSSPSEVKIPDPPDSRNRRIIDRDSLYEDPEFFHKNNIEDLPSQSPCNSPTNPTPPANEWTQEFWHKASEKLEETTQGSSGKYRKHAAGLNIKIQKKLDKMLAKPVKMTKAESMMQKMGWQGGALGRSGDGIVEPIAPNAVYAKKKVGFGQHVQLNKPVKTTNKTSKQVFEMNVLLNIFDFVKNNSEVEILFDRKLKKEERKKIHNIVQFKLKAEDLAMVDFDSTAHFDLVLNIGAKNCYILQTQSSGVHPYRQLCIYKEAPPHVYLLIPDDLKDEEDEEQYSFPEELKQNVPEQDEPKIEVTPDIEPKVDEIPVLKPEIEETNVLQPTIPEVLPPKEEKEVPEEIVEEVEMAPEVEIEEETNPFLRSITRNLKKPKVDVDSQEIEDPENPINMETSPLPEVLNVPDDKSEVEKIPESVKIPELENDPESKVPEMATHPMEEKPQIPDQIMSPMSEIMARIVDYFTEFAGDKNYTQFKFLGPFTDEEIHAINEFLEEAMKYLSNEDESQLAPIFDKVAFDINDDCSGNTVIYKRIINKKHRKKKGRKDSNNSNTHGTPKKMVVDETVAD